MIVLGRRTSSLRSRLKLYIWQICCNLASHQIHSQVNLTLAWQISQQYVRVAGWTTNHWHDKSWLNRTTNHLNIGMTNPGAHTHTANKSIWRVRGQTAWVAWPINNRPQYNTVIHSTYLLGTPALSNDFVFFGNFLRERFKKKTLKKN